MWADQIRDAGVVRWPYGQAARSLIHERDIAAVAIRALTDDGHAGARYVLTGPETLTAATASPFEPSIGALTHRAPMTASSSSSA